MTKYFMKTMSETEGFSLGLKCLETAEPPPENTTPFLVWFDELKPPNQCVSVFKCVLAGYIETWTGRKQWAFYGATMVISELERVLGQKVAHKKLNCEHSIKQAVSEACDNGLWPEPMRPYESGYQTYTPLRRYTPVHWDSVTTPTP